MQRINLPREHERQLADGLMEELRQLGYCTTKRFVMVDAGAVLESDSKDGPWTAVPKVEACQKSDVVHGSAPCPGIYKGGSC